MSARGDVPANNEGNRASDAQTAGTDGVGHRRLVVDSDSPETHNSLPRSAAVTSGTAPVVRHASVRRQMPRDESLQSDANDGSREPPMRRQRQVLRRCCDCSRSSTCALSKPTARSLACPCRVANQRCTSCACFGNCQNKREPLPTTTATLRCFFAAPNANATTDQPPAAIPDPLPAPTPDATELLPAPPQASQQSAVTTATTDDAADDGMTPEPMAQATTPPTEERGDPSAPEDPEPVAPAANDAFPACPPAAAAAANRAAAPVLDDPEVAPGPVITQDEGADLPGYTVTAADRLLDAALGDHVHDNAGIHLDGGVATDALWQRRWRRMAQIATTRYQAPPGKVGRRFLTILVSEFCGARERRWNSERPLVFVATVLQTTPGVRRSKDIRLRLTQRMDLWDQGQFKALVDDTEGEVLSRGSSSRPPDDEAQARAFNARVLSGRLRSAVRALTNRSGGGRSPTRRTLFEGGSPCVAGASREAPCPP